MQSAPGVKTRLLDATGGTRTFVVIFDKGDEARQGLTTFVTEQQVTAAHFTAVGGFSHAVLGYFSRDSKEYEHIPVEEQVEVLSLVGDVAVKPDGTPEVHAHVVVGRRDGTTRGGHLLEGSVWPTLEVVMTDSPNYLRKTPDPETGLALINPQA
jgi:predicted DNA-binding protein with PD1-like motif